MCCAQKDAREAFEALNEAHRMMRDPGLFVRLRLCTRLDTSLPTSLVPSIQDGTELLLSGLPHVEMR